jgi:WD40 repeat protein
VGFHDGTIAFLNLKKDQIIFTVKQKLTPSAIAFSVDHSWMATGDEQGNVILWDLESKRILYKFERCIEGAIDSLVFIPGLPVLTCGSAAANCLRQLRVNLEDNRILSLYRERVGNQLSLEHVTIGGNNELVLSTASESMFMSFYAQCNNYLLPRSLDSRLPYHLIAKNFTVQLYKERSLFKTFKLTEFPVVGKISLSNKYYIVATQRRLVKLGASYETDWKISNIFSIVLYN